MWRLNSLMGMVLTSRPSTKRTPSSTLEVLAIRSTMVVLPAPVRPIRPTFSPAFMVKETSRNDDEVIEAFSIIDIINVFGLPRVDLLKLDIEGSEYDIFSHDYKTWLPYVNAIVIETHDNIIEGCEELVNRVLKNEGFILSEYEENNLFKRGSKL